MITLVHTKEACANSYIGSCIHNFLSLSLRGVGPVLHNLWTRKRRGGYEGLRPVSDDLSGKLKMFDSSYTLRKKLFFLLNN